MNANRSIWRFTIREMIFGMTAIAAIMALVINNRPFSVSPFFHGFQTKQSLESISQDLGLKLSCNGQGGASSQGPDGVDRDQMLSIRMPGAQLQGKVMTALYRETKKALEDLDCSIRGNGRSGSLHQETIDSFHFEYQNRNSRGFYKAFSFGEKSDGSWELLVIQAEW